jgi:hypothetical protein
LPLDATPPGDDRGKSCCPRETICIPRYPIGARIANAAELRDPHRFSPMPGTEVDMAFVIMKTNTLSEILDLDLDRVCGGVDFNSIKAEAQPYCPNTVAKYSKVNPSTITRATAQQMGNECVAEINPLMRGIARGKIQAGIDQAFPPK